MTTQHQEGRLHSEVLALTVNGRRVLNTVDYNILEGWVDVMVPVSNKNIEEKMALNIEENKSKEDKSTLLLADANLQWEKKRLTGDIVVYTKIEKSSP